VRPAGRGVVEEAGGTVGHHRPVGLGRSDLDRADDDLRPEADADVASARAVPVAGFFTQPVTARATERAVFDLCPACGAVVPDHWRTPKGLKFCP